MSVFSAELKKSIESELTRYETRRSAILPILHLIQDTDGWVQEHHIEELHQNFGLDRVSVREVLTFYSMYRKEKPRPFEVLFCNNLVCHMMGADAAMEKIEARIAEMEAKGQEVKLGLHGVPCLGVCGGAPAMLVNKNRHLCVTAENVDQVIDQYLKEG